MESRADESVTVGELSRPVTAWATVTRLQPAGGASLRQPVSLSRKLDPPKPGHVRTSQVRTVTSGDGPSRAV